jgi:hypothetical protein
MPLPRHRRCDPRDLRRGHGRGARRCARARRVRDGGAGTADHRGEPARLPDPAQGARHRLPARQPAPLAAQPRQVAIAHPQRDRAGDPRLLLRARIPARGHADPHGRHRRALGALRHGVLRRGERVSRADGTALRRGGRRRVREDLHVRPHLPRREVQDAPSPHRVLDDRARGGVQRHARQHAAAGGVRLLPRGARAGAAAGGAEGARARPSRWRRCGALSADRLHRRRGHAAEEGEQGAVGRRPRRRGRGAPRGGPRPTPCSSATTPRRPRPST